MAGQSRGQIVWSDIRSNSLDDSTNVDKYSEGTRQREAMKYLKGKLLLAYHRIKCSVANFLAALMWRKSRNNAALTTPTHRGPKRVSDETSSQVEAWMINKWRAKIVQRELYNGRDLP